MNKLQALRAADDLRNLATEEKGNARDLLLTLAKYVESMMPVPADLRDGYVRWLNGQQKQTKFGN